METNLFTVRLVFKNNVKYIILGFILAPNACTVVKRADTYIVTIICVFIGCVETIPNRQSAS
jgi:hypothetical protein